MRKKLFFLIVFGFMLSFATKAQTQQVIAKLVNVPDIYYSGVDTLSTDYINTRLVGALQFTLADGTTSVTPSFTISKATISQINQGVLIQNGVSVAIDLTPGGGYGFLPEGAPEGSYENSASIKGTITIRPLPLAVTVAAGAVADKAYDGNATATIKDASKITFTVDASATAAYLHPSIVIGTTKITVPASAYTATAVYSSPDVATANPATVTIDVTNPGTSNYTIASGSPATLSDAGVKINPAKLTIASIAFASTTKVYDGAPLTVTGVTFNATPAITPAPVLNTDYTVNTALLPVDAGVYKGTELTGIVTWSGSPNYTLATADNKVTLGDYSISPVQLTVTALGQKRVYDGTDGGFDVNTKGVAFTVTPDPAGVTFTGELEWAKNKNVGTYAITQGTLATTSSNYYINFVVPATAKDTITPLAVTIAAQDTTIAFGSTLDRTKQLIPTVTPALVGTDKITGSYTIYDITGATVLNDPLSVGTDSIGKSNTATGNKTIDDGNGGKNYTITYQGALLTVNSAPVLTITPIAGQFKTYGEPDPALAYKITGFVAPDTEASIKALLTGNLSYTGSPSADAGTYPLELGTLDFATPNPNYTLAIAASAVNFEIRKANVIVTPKALLNQFLQAQTLFDYADVFDVALLNGDDAVTVFAGKTITRNGAKNSATATPLSTDSVGKYDYKIGTLATDLINYNLILTSVTPLAQYTITPDTVYVLPTPGLGKGFGDADPAALKTAYTVVDVAGTLITPAVKLTGDLKRAAGENIGTYAYDVSGLTNPQHAVALSSQADKFTISKGVIEVNVKDTTGIYGSAATTLDATYYTVKPADLPAGTLTGTVVRAGVAAAAPKATDPAGIYAVSQGDLAVADPNYSLVFHAGTYTIEPKVLKVTPVAGQKEYGDEDPIFTYTVEGLLDGDKQDSIFVGALDRISGYNVGTYAIINGLQADSLTLKQPSNYSYNSKTDFTTGVLFEITPAALTVYPKAASKTYGAADPTNVFAAITDANRSAVLDSIRGWKLGAATGLNVDGDSKLTGKLVREAGNDAGKYNYLATSLIVPSNYTVTIGGPNQFTINQKAIVVTPVDTFKVFGQEDPIIRFVASGLVSPDTQATAFTGNLTRVAGENVGTYAINNVGSDSLQAKNYTFTPASGKTFTILKADSLVEEDLVITYPQDYPPVYYDGNPYGVSVSVPGIDARAISVKYHDENGREISGAPINAGSYIIVVTVTATENNNLSVITLTDPFVISKAEVQVTPKAGQSKVVGEADPKLSYDWVYIHPAPTTPNLIGVPFDGELSRVAGEAVGTYLIEAGTLKAGNNYNLAIDSTVVFTISEGATPPEPIEVTVTIDNVSKVYGQTDPAFTYESSIAGITFTGKLTRAAGEDAGEYVISKGTLAVSADYTLKVIEGKLTIEKADQVLTFNALAPVKNGDTFALNASVNTGLALTYASSDETVATVSATGIVTAKKVGKTNITVSQAGTVNYKAVSKTQELVVEKGTGIDNIVAEGQVSIYPSVAQRNSTITLDANVNVNKAELAVYSINGKLISVTPVINTVTTLSAPSEAGAYIYVFKAEGINKTMKVLVK